MNEEKLTRALRLMICNDRMHKKIFDVKLKSMGLHRSAHIILVNIAECGGLPSQKALADKVGITPAAVTGTLKKLEKCGFIERKCAEDNRYNIVNVTEKGYAALKEARSSFCEVDRSMFDGFTDSEIESYISCQEKMRANIEKKMAEREVCQGEKMA